MKSIIYEDLCNIKTKYITKKQTPETNEAVDLLAKAKVKYRIAINSLLLSALISLIVMIIVKEGIPIIIFGILFWLEIITTIILIELRQNYLKPYYELLNTAINNDRIRHEERIRFRERKRLEQQEQINYSKKDNTFLPKQQLTQIKIKEIQNLKQIKIEEKNQNTGENTNE